MRCLGPSYLPVNPYPPPYGQNARDLTFPLPWTLTPVHLRALSHSLAGLFGGQIRVLFIIDTYRKHERRTISGPLGPAARCLRERAHVGGQRPCAADARAPGAVACVCTMSRRAEGRPCRGLIRTP